MVPCLRLRGTRVDVDRAHEPPARRPAGMLDDGGVSDAQRPWAPPGAASDGAGTQTAPAAAPGADPHVRPAPDPGAPLGMAGGSVFAADDGAAPPPTARAVTLGISIVTTALLLAAAAVLPVPYVITSPGPTFDTLGEVGDAELITVVGAPSYDSEGELRFTTVSLSGGPSRRLPLLSVLDAWLAGDEVVSPVESYFPPDQTEEEADELSTAEMLSSQEAASVAALEELGYEVPTAIVVQDLVEGSGAVGLVEAEDVLVAVDGDDIADYAELTAVMDAKEPGDVVTITVLRDGSELDLDITTTDDGTGRALLGIFLDLTFDLPVDVQIRIEDVGGPSAGMMFALGIVNSLTEPDETGGARIAGTGTIDLDGHVGPIGGIAQKMVGADEAGVAWFLAPVANCSEVVGAEPDGLGVVAVETLAEARAAVEAIGSGSGDTLRTCGEVLAEQG